MADLPPLPNSSPDPEAAPVGTSLSAQAAQAAPNPQPRWQGARSLLIWALRWAGLGVGVSGAWLVGLLVANWLPGPGTQPPLQEMVVRRTQRVGQKLRSLPQWWQGDRWQTPAPAPPLLSPPDPEGVQPRPIRLSEAQREQITTELEAVQAEVQRLRDRASALEIQLGLTPLSAPLEGRLGTIASRLSPDTDTPVAAVAPLSNPGNPPGSATTTAPTLPVPPLLQVRAYRVTLPSDLLFTGEEGILQPSATQLLDSILVDVGRYPGATILVGSYTDPQGSGETGAEVSFQQAIAVQRYLSARLGEDQYRWLAVGYGHSGLGNYNETPLTRRIAIAIVPPS